MTIKNIAHHAAIPDGELRVVPSRGGKSFLIIAANGQAIAETVPTQNPRKSMARAALLAHSLNSFPRSIQALSACKDAGLHTAGKIIESLEDISKIGI